MTLLLNDYLFTIKIYWKQHPSVVPSSLYVVIYLDLQHSYELYVIITLFYRY